MRQRTAPRGDRKLVRLGAQRSASRLLWRLTVLRALTAMQIPNEASGTFRWTCAGAGRSVCLFHA
jgi:hypothetical protein